MNFETLARSRRSVRKFSDRPVDADLIANLLELACQAPSGHNRQPWRFAVLVDPATRTALAEAMGARLRADRLADGDDPQAVEADVARSRARITGAPSAVLVCLTLQDMDRYPDERRSAAEHLMAVQSTAMAGQNLLLAAHAVGLGACWMCAPLFSPQAARQALSLPADWEPQGLVLLGWPVERARTRARRPASEVTRYL